MYWDYDSKSVRTRFAPSPTGYLHLGNARIAIINYIVARQKGGQFLLRIEDTDRERSRVEYIEAIYQDLSWLGLFWDEEPLLQSQRVEIYRQRALQLWKEGKAYPCFCTPEELAKEREEALKKGKPPRYSKRCRKIPVGLAWGRIVEGEPFSLRFKIEGEGRVEWRDVVKGKKRFKRKDLNDFILLRSDGTPTYHLAVVVDDGEMGVTDVIRGEDHLSNTPYHILLFEALGYPLPRFAHIPLLRAPSGGILEKREESEWTIKRLREQGYLPGSIISHLTTLGWNPPHKPPLAMEEILGNFSLHALSSSPVSFAPKGLDAQNTKMVHSMDLSELAHRVKPYLPPGIFVSDEKLTHVLTVVRENAKTLRDLAQWIVRIEEGEGISPSMREVELEFLRGFLNYYVGGIEWDEALEASSKKVSLSRPHAMKVLRKGLVGVEEGPLLSQIMRVLGRERVSDRLKILLQ